MTVQNLPLQYRSFLQSPCLLTSHLNDGVKAFRLKTSPQPEAGIPEVPANLVFGKRIERFFSHYIHTSEEYEMLAENLQVIKDKVTLGELDFLLREKQTERILHVELAFKFYLYLDEDIPNELAKWAGPNRRDFLSKKLEKLTERQFPLLYRPETRGFLAALRISAEETEQQLCLQGFLFLPFSRKDVRPPLVNPDAVKGYWIHGEEFRKDEFRQHQFFLPEKQLWTLHPRHNSEWFSHAEAEKIIASALNERKSPMLWMKTANGKYDRFFVVWW